MGPTKRKTPMMSRERVRTVLCGGIPDAVPHALYDVAIDTYNESTLDLFREKTGKHPRGVFHHDLQGLRLPARPCPDEWLKRIRDAVRPDDFQALMQDWWPTRGDARRLRQQVDVIHRAGRAALAVGWASDFETAFTLRGRDQFFMDLGYREKWLPVFIDYLADAAAEDMRLATQAGADIVGIGDDLGSQRGLLINPMQWRELFRPRLERIIDAVKNANRDTAFFLHTDGKVDEIIPDLIEIGVDILNPVQPEVMDPARVKRTYGDKLVFFGAISVQHTLPFGTPEDVADEVKLRIETIGVGGGYIMTPSHLINPDIPWENIVAFFKAAAKHGRYDGCGDDQGSMKGL